MSVHPSSKTEIRPAKPRTTVQVTFPDQRVFEGPPGTRLEAFIQAAYPNPRVPIVAAVVDSILRELTYIPPRDVTVSPVDMSTMDGMRIYRRSLLLLLLAAFEDLFPDAQLVVEHSLTFGGYYCEVEGRDPLSEEELQRLEKHMWELVEADLPIVKEEVPLEEARRLFQERGADDKVRLFRFREKDYVTLYRLKNTVDYLHGYMVPSTGYIRVFGLAAYEPGFVLRFPHRHEPLKLQPITHLPRLVAVFRQHSRWMELMNVMDVGSLNEKIHEGKIQELILIAETLHEQCLANITREITKRGNVRIVLIAGPSSSGKTTFSKRLSVQLLASGIRPFAISMDDYFVNREDTPRDEEGNYDFDSPQALDIDLLNEQLHALLRGEEVTLPRFDFITGHRGWGPTVRLHPDQVIIMEGIHGLNPLIAQNVPQEHTFRIYVSALTVLNLDRHNRISTTDTRLIRRIVRDARTRGRDAEGTILMWGNVRRAERLYIFPYQEHADMMFNSALVYELATLRTYAEPLLLQVEPTSPAYMEARRLVSFLRWFLPHKDGSSIPNDSILREFIGGSILEEFNIGVEIAQTHTWRAIDS
ncbi:MAG: nucleoside kinase [Chloroflexi bacterium]|nr:nucleoside kinase [Chloroflexota bacterium]